MQAATGELNLTLVIVVAIGLLLALFTSFMWPTIKNKLTNGFNNVKDKPIVGNNGTISYNFTDYIQSELF